MAAYVEHAAYYVNQMDWYLNFFQQVFQMQVQKQRQGADGLREVWLEGGVQLCETTAPALEDGRCAHLCLIVEDLEQAREKGLSLGCTPMEKYHWIRLPDGLCIEMFPAAEGVVPALQKLVKHKA